MTENIIDVLTPAVVDAAAAILKIYNSDFAVERKEDKSPLTTADRRSHDILSEFLKSLFSFPVLSEEGKNIPYEERRRWQNYWLLDPLDGTKEFINRNGDFTINIALIHEHRPVLGLIYIPVSGVLYYAKKGAGAFKVENTRTERLPLSGKSDRLTIVGSRSHASKELDQYVDEMRNKYGDIQFVSRGSSLKFCLVAEGKADVYPRLGPTMEWDTAAGQIIVEESGGRVLEYKTQTALGYNKKDLVNPYFLANR